MNKFVQYTLIVAAAGSLTYSAYEFNRPICSKPLKYNIGYFDESFGITEEEFKLTIVKAESVWERELGRDVFIYDPKADFKINLIYDEKQFATMQKQKTESGLSKLESDFELLDQKLASLKREYDSKVGSYERAAAAFNQRKTAYDAEAASWNEKGGAPRDVYLSLESQREDLNSEADRLNLEAADINTTARTLNSLIGERNAKAAAYNQAAREYNKKYGAGLEFNQAEYTGKAINIYQFASERELLLALTHEFGHVLGMDHVDNPESIMYYLTTADAETSVTLSAEDLAELGRVCD